MTASNPALITSSQLPNPDDFYEDLIETHRGLTTEQSSMVNAKLILLLANHIGDIAVLREALTVARKGYEPAGDVTSAE